MIYADYPAAVLKPAKKRSSPRGNWIGYRKDPRPIKKISTKSTLARACRYDWLHESIFETKTINQSFVDTNSNPQKIVAGYYFVTCTIDYKKSGLVENGIVKLDEWFRLHSSTIETPVSRHRRATKEQVQAPPCALQLDQHHAGGLHMHMLIVPRNDFEASIVQRYVSWWQENHGSIDIRPVDSREGVLKCLRYIFKTRGWHNLLQGPQFQAVAAKRNLGMVSPRNLPKVAEIKLVTSGKENGKKHQMPAYVVAKKTAHILKKILPIAVSSIDNLQEAADRILQEHRDPIAILSAVIATAVSTQNKESAKQVLIDRMTAESYVESYLTIYRKGGLRKAYKFLAESCKHTDAHYAYNMVETLLSFGLDCGLKITNNQHETRYQWDRNLAPIVGVRALTYEELRTKIDLRNSA